LFSSAVFAVATTWTQTNIYHINAGTFTDHLINNIYDITSNIYSGKVINNIYQITSNIYSGKVQSLVPHININGVFGLIAQNVEHIGAQIYAKGARLAGTFVVQALAVTCQLVGNSYQCSVMLPTSSSGGGGGGGGGGGSVVTVGLPPLLSWTISFAIVSLPALFLAFFAGPAGLFIGLILGIGIGASTGLLPGWLVIVLGLGMILLIAFRIRGGERD